MKSKITSIFTAFAISSLLTTTAVASDQDTAPFSQLVDAVVKLKAKTIAQAYFWLGSPQVPDSTIFTPDTKNGELLATGMITALAADTPVHVVKATYWQPVGYLEHIAEAEASLKLRDTDLRS